MITLLATDGVMGLQICKDRNAKLQKWEYVPSIEGAIVVNLGDMMERWSNGFSGNIFLLGILDTLGLLIMSVFNLQINIAPGYFKWTESIFNSIFRGTESRLHNRVSSNLPVRKQSSKYPAIKCSAYLTQRYEESHLKFSSYKKTNLSEVCSPPSFHYP
ncbi:hypothetical protein HID58_095257, partial [Brassica napus]